MTADGPQPSERQVDKSVEDTFPASDPPATHSSHDPPPTTRSARPPKRGLKAALARLVRRDRSNERSGQTHG